MYVLVFRDIYFCLHTNDHALAQTHLRDTATNNVCAYVYVCNCKIGIILSVLFFCTFTSWYKHFLMSLDTVHKSWVKDKEELRTLVP